MSETKKARVVFTPKAWSKMWLLVDNFNSEVAWNGLCRRDAEHENWFWIEDILVHAQTVTSGTVRTDPVQYDAWLDTFDDDTFNRIRMHGHSHYYAGAFASQLDVELQNDIIAQLSGDMFYIFLIVNRRRDIWVKIVDKKTDTTYDCSTSEWDVRDDDFSVAAFLPMAKSLVTVHTPKFNHKFYPRYQYEQSSLEEIDDGFSEVL